MSISMDYLVLEKQNKRVMIIGIIATFISMVIGIYTFVSKSEQTNDNEINIQINTLNSMSKNLKEMLDFVEIQKKKITNEQSILEGIQNQRKEIELLLNTDRQTVEAIMKAQKNNERKNVWIEWIIAFFLGISSSMAATLLYNKFIIKRKTFRETN